MVPTKNHLDPDREKIETASAIPENTDEAPDFRDFPTIELEDTIEQLGSLHAATHKVLLDAIAAYDDSKGWREDGATSAAAWLGARLGLSPGTAAEWMRVAHALRDLPAVAAAYLEGRLSWDKVRALTRIATPETDTDLAERGASLTPQQVDVMVRRELEVPKKEVDEALRQRGLRWWWDKRTLRISGRLGTRTARS